MDEKVVSAVTDIRPIEVQAKDLKFHISRTKQETSLINYASTNGSKIFEVIANDKILKSFFFWNGKFHRD